MNSDIAFLLLGYPLSILANVHTDYFVKKLSNKEVNSLKAVFIDAFLLSLKNNQKKVDSIGKEAIKQVEKEIKRDKEKLFHIISNSIGDDYFNILEINRSELSNRISDAIHKEYRLLHTSLSRAVVLDCLRHYEMTFFSNLTEKDGVHFLAKCLNKLNSDVAKQSDIEELKEFLISKLSLHKSVDNKLHQLTNLLYQEISDPVSREFSSSIVDYMDSIRKKVEQLTADQYQIIHHLRYRKRVLISGCAGSGKTLLVAEKAIRLDHAGIRVLILCHNPHLVDYIRNLVCGSSVDVFDITTYVNCISDQNISDETEWHRYSEPLENDIERAFDNINSSDSTYEAVIVDEGQDFRELWWLLVEAILEKSTSKILYVFYDDNQSLLPFRSKYPIEESPISMSKNCRNGGNIFEIVKRFHPDSPLVSQFLTSDGIAKLTVFSETDRRIKLIEALHDAAGFVNYNQVSIVTNEVEITDSTINGTEFVKYPSLDWRLFVFNDLKNARNRLLKKIEALRSSSSISEIANRYNFHPDADLISYFKLPILSHSLEPSKADKIAVTHFARKLLPAFDGQISQYVKFKIQSSKLRLVEYKPPNYEKFSEARKSSRIRFYANDNWSHSLPTKVLTAKVVPFTNNVISDDNTIPLYSINTIKGLEASAIILFINEMNRELEMEMYVGSSRAIGYLNIVINRSVLSRIHKLNDL